MPESAPALNVTYIADLARLRLTPEETALYQKQLSDVLGYVTQLQEVDVSSVMLLGKANMQNRLRPDVLQPSLTAEEALANAPAQENNLFLMPKIVE